jgi:Zn finger protein HypA/HybF involved in hydrogenase expression
MNDHEKENLKEDAYILSWENGWFQGFYCETCKDDYGLKPDESYCPECGSKIRTAKPVWKQCSRCNRWFPVEQLRNGRCKPCAKIIRIKKHRMKQNQNGRTGQCTPDFSPVSG